MTTLEQLAGSSGDTFDDLDAEILKASTDEIVNRTRLLENDVKVLIAFIHRYIEAFVLYCILFIVYGIWPVIVNI